MSKLTMKERLTARLAKADIIDGSTEGTVRRETPTN
jgi:hypothetical protein